MVTSVTPRAQASVWTPPGSIQQIDDFERPSRAVAAAEAR